MKTYDLIIIGDGISSKALCYYLTKKDPFLKKVAVVSDAEMAPACSLSTTSIVSLFGTQKGLSDLGELNVDSYKAFDAFVKETRPEGVSSAKQFHLDPQGPESLVKRFGQAKAVSSLTQNIELPQKTFMAQESSYVVYSKVFMEWLDKQVNTTPAVELVKLNYHVRSINYNDDGVVVDNGKQKLMAQTLVLCSGAHTKINEALYPKEKPVKNSKVVSGSYIQFNNVNWGDEDLIFTLNKNNLIYRHLDNTLLLGGTHCSIGIYLPYVKELKKSFEYFQSVLGGSLSWPSFKSGEFITGLRHKGQKRRPFYGKLENNVYAQIGLYKNGFSYPFFMAPELLRLIKNDLMV
ncbi:MAG: FAD-dependent oxidoreductase [Bacteriovoracaceae bacterium]